MGQVLRKEGSVLKAMEAIEHDLDRKNRNLKRISQKLDSILENLQKNREDLTSAEGSLMHQKGLLKKRAKALYKWQRGGSPFVLLNESGSLGELMRRKRYLEILLEKDKAILASLVRDSERYKDLSRQFEARKKRLDQQRRALVDAKRAVRKEKEKKRRMLASLRSEKKLRTQTIKELEESAQQLQKMIHEMNRKGSAKGSVSYGSAGFAALKGQLNYPTMGRVVGDYGASKHPEFSEDVFRHGIDIEAPLGEEIRTVERGKVIFADQFSGYGKMMIIDHGKRYYTIYAHLSELLKRAGQTVQRGEPIALVGETGSLRGTGLYFEIRKDGKPLDPLPWFRRR